MDAVGLDFDATATVAVDPNAVWLVNAAGVGRDSSVSIIPRCPTVDCTR